MTQHNRTHSHSQNLCILPNLSIAPPLPIQEKKIEKQIHSQTERGTLRSHSYFFTTSNPRYFYIEYFYIKSIESAVHIPRGCATVKGHRLKVNGLTHRGTRGMTLRIAMGSAMDWP